MRSPFATLRTLVLPAGAISGTRIVLNGVTGALEFYNATNDLVGRLQPDTIATTGLVDMLIMARSPSDARAYLFSRPGDAGLALGPPDWVGHVIGVAGIRGDVDTGAELAWIQMDSPVLDGLPIARLFIRGAGLAAAARPAIIADSATGTYSPEVNFNVSGQEIPQGFRAVVTNNAATGAIFAETVIATINNFVFRAGRAYRWSTGPALSSIAAGQVFAVYQVRRTNLAGAVVGITGAVDIPNPGNIMNGEAAGYLRRTATTDTTDTVVLTLTGSGPSVTQNPLAPVDRWFLIEDCGAASAYTQGVVIT